MNWWEKLSKKWRYGPAALDNIVIMNDNRIPVAHNEIVQVIVEWLVEREHRIVDVSGKGATIDIQVWKEHTILWVQCWTVMEIYPQRVGIANKGKENWLEVADPDFFQKLDKALVEKGFLNDSRIRS